MPVHLESSIVISRYYLTSSSRQNDSTPTKSIVATLLSGLLLRWLVQVHVPVDRRAPVLALEALLTVLPLSVVPGAILVVGVAVLVAAVVSWPNAVLVVTLLFNGTALVLQKEVNS